MPPVSKPKKSRSRPRGLTETEEKILRAVNDLHLVDADAITRLLTANTARSHYGKLLTKLSGGADCSQPAYLLKFRMPNTIGNSRFLHTLTKRGAALLRELGVEADWWYRPTQARHSHTFLTHQLGITQFLVALCAFVRDYPEYELIETRTSYTMEKKPPAFAFVADKREIKASVIPDAWVYISHPTREYALAIEIDTGTEGSSKYQQLVRNRIEFYKSGQYAKYYNTSSVLLCYLVVGMSREDRFARLDRIRQWTQEVLGERLTHWSSVFRFQTLDERVYKSHRLFTDPVWLLPGESPSLITLFEA